MENWFKEWFNTKYYHILYNNRNNEEAAQFLSKLIFFLGLKPKNKILDVACGKGRHSIFLESLGFYVEGFDISEESICYAKKFENENLHFYTHDMRCIYKDSFFDCTLNLFTSFGYFNNEEDEKKSMLTICNSIKKDGVIVIDYLNAKNPQLLSESTECIQKNNIEFIITKKITDNKIIKTINFKDNGQDFHFEEHVKLLTYEWFKNCLQNNHFEILNYFGDYQLNSYKEYDSSRLIIIAKKK